MIIIIIYYQKILTIMMILMYKNIIDKNKDIIKNI